MDIILAFVGLVFIISVYVENNSATKVKNCILLGITLPPSEIKNKQVLEIVENFKKANNRFLGLSALIFIPTFFISYISIIFLYMFIWIIGLLYGTNKILGKYSNKIKEIKVENNWFMGNKILLASDKTIYTDNDEYWKNGIYNNPNDPRTMIEKRIGYGLTYNMATKKGKRIVYGSYIIGLAIPILLLFQFFIFDFSKYNLTINNNEVKISAPIYGTTFSVEDIEEVKIIDKMEKGIRTNGVGTERYSLGHYSVNSYGNSLLYIYWDSKPYIEIKLKDKYIFINGTSAEETEEYYNNIKNSLNNDF